MEKRSVAFLLAGLLPIGLMCSAFNEQVLSDVCDGYKAPFGQPGDFESCQAEQVAAKKFAGIGLGNLGSSHPPNRGDTTKASSIIGCELHKSSGSLLDRVGGSGLLPEKRSETG